ncbi:MAG: hypothetical protein E7594_01705 [Ruminococcaceae bacterium]|nr:hypothetical protein [Oscillospiraceae bacterium]
MTKKFIKDNRGQVLYAVVVTVMFVGVLSMITMGMTLKNYQNAVKKQENIRNYYAADAVVEKIRVGAIAFIDDSEIRDEEYDATAELLEKGESKTVSTTKSESQVGDELTKTKTIISIHNEKYQVTCGTTIVTVTMNVVTTEIQTFVTTVIEDEQPDNQPADPPADQPEGQADDPLPDTPETTQTRTIIGWEVSYNAE